MPYLRFGGGWASTPTLPLKPADDPDKPSPPPPYEHAAASRSGFVAHTTTTTTITQTTTTFIPLTLWHDDRAVNLDKDLPATPTSSNNHKPEPGSSRSSSPLTDRPIVALAHASLGLGLHPPPSPTRQNGHAAAGLLTVDAQRPRPSRVASNPVLRKSRSFGQDMAQRDPAREPAHVSPVPPVPSVPPTPEKRPVAAVATSSAFQEKRTRRLSFGASLLAPFRTQAVAAADLPPSPPPSNLTRKSSFWVRKRATTLQVDTQSQQPPQPSESEKTPSLPSMQPFTPLAIDNLPSPTKQPPLHPIQQYSISSSSFIIPDSPANNLPTTPGSAGLRRRSTISSAGQRSPRVSLDITPAPAPGPTPRTSTASSSPRVSFLQPTLSRPASSEPLRLHDSPVSTPIESQSPSTTPEPKLAPRQRAMTNPTLFRRISFFATPSTPAPPVEDVPQPQPPPPKPPPPPVPQGETPEVYVQRLLEVVTKAEVANVLAASNDEFHVRALQAYMDRFAFDGDPLDVALRKLLMHMALPRETQQIDRVMEAFAARYSHCNPNLFASADTPYVLAFSLMMLHTDAFNKSNKRKMTKADYVKNTRLPGVQPELLEYFWDQITFAPFIFIEDPLDVNGSRLFATGSTSSSALSTPSSLLGRSNRVDPYYLIAQDLLGPLRVDVRAVISYTDPYSVHGGDSHVHGAWDARDLQRVFATAPLVELEDKDTVDRRKSVMIGGFPPTLTVPSVMPSLAYPPGELTLDEPWPGEILTLRVTKVGVLWRKDELAEGGRRASSRKWREWSVVLTGSQLLFFRDPSVATGLIPSSFESPKDDVAAGTTVSKAQFLVPEIEILRPDEILSVEDSVALCDATYDKYPHAFRFSMPKGRQLLLRATNEAELIAWLALINYASAFKTAGVRMRPLGLSWKEIEGAGMAAARSHLRDLQQQRTSGTTSPSSSSSKPVRSWASGHGKTSGEHQRDSGSRRPSLALSSFRQSSATLPLSARHSQSPTHPRPRPRASWSGGTDGLDMMDTMLPDFDMSEQFKATFDEVKAELATSGAGAGNVRRKRRPSTAPAPAAEEERPMPPTIASRAELINTKIRDLDSHIAAAAPALEAELRFANQLSVLTPFRQTTRDRIVAILGQLARKVAYLRMNLAKMRVHRDTLAADVAEERRQWIRTRNQALQIASAALNNSKAAVLPRVSVPDSSQPSSPRSPRSPGLRISASALRQHGMGITPDPRHLSPNDPNATFMTPSTPGGSVDSHMSSLGQSDTELEHVDSLGPLSSSLSSTGGLLGNLSGASTSSVASRADRSSTSLTSPSPHHEKFFTATESPEEAEEWDRTRAAKRVSLVRLPADTLAVIFNQHTRHISDGPPGDQSDVLARAATPRAEAHMRSSSSSH